jgi:hypothetical protein
LEPSVLQAFFFFFFSFYMEGTQVEGTLVKGHTHRSEAKVYLSKGYRMNVFKAKGLKQRVYLDKGF